MSTPTPTPTLPLNNGENIQDTQTLLQVAVKAHQNGDLATAQQSYRRILSSDPMHVYANYNLGMLFIEQGLLKSGLQLIDNIKAFILNQQEHAKTYLIIGTKLFDNNHWEAARFWLQQAIVFYPDDPRITFMLQRSSPRLYLKPEVYDPLSEKTLLRYSPREAETYIYTIDIAGTCNLRCPSCPVGNTHLGDRSIGMMDYQLFSDILDKIQKESPSLKPQIWLFNWGEPLLHPRLPMFIQKIKELGYSSHLSSNLNITSGISELVKARPDELKISLSGFTDATYSVTHARGNLKLLKANMYLLKYEMEKQRKNFRVWVGQHVYKHNVNEVEMVKEICQELEFEHHPIQAFFQPIEKLVRLMQGQRAEQDKQLLDMLLKDPQEYLTKIKEHRSGNYDCELRFNQTVINYDGEVALCCSTYEKQNTLGIQFLDYDHKQIEEKKYTHEFCKSCKNCGCDYSSTEPMDKASQN